MSEHNRISPVVREGEIITGFQGRCSCGWVGHFYPVGNSFGTAELDSAYGEARAHAREKMHAEFTDPGYDMDPTSAEPPRG